MTKAFEKYQEIKKSIYEAFPKEEGKEAVLTISSLKESVRQKGDQIFYINSKTMPESLQLTLSPNGVLKKANYIDSSEDKNKSIFLAKDFEKLSSTVKDTNLIKAASLIDWSKAPEQEVEKSEKPAKEVAEEETELADC